MQATIIPTMYRDAANWKVHGEVVLEGVLTAALKDELRTALKDGLYYVPAQINLRHYGADEYSTYPSEDDHGWHEMWLDQAQVDYLDGKLQRLFAGEAGRENGGAVEQFVARVRAACAAGWDPALHTA